MAAAPLRFVKSSAIALFPSMSSFFVTRLLSGRSTGGAAAELHKLTSFFCLQRQREAAELALNGGEGQQQQMQEPEEEM